jgi:hypothetical protein
MKQAEYVTRMRDMIGKYRVLVGTSDEKRPLGNPGVDGRIILKLNFKKWDGETWTGLLWRRLETGYGRVMGHRLS